MASAGLSNVSAAAVIGSVIVLCVGVGGLAVITSDRLEGPVHQADDRNGPRDMPVGFKRLTVVLPIVFGIGLFLIGTLVMRHVWAGIALGIFGVLYFSLGLTWAYDHAQRR